MSKPVSNSQKVLKGISSQTLVTIVLGLVEILSFSIMSRLLTKQDFGYYAAISAVVVVFASFSETGIGSAIVQCKNLTKRFIDNAFTMSLAFGSLISLLLFSLSNVLAQAVADESMAVPLMLMSVTLLLHCLTSVFFSLMHRRLEFLRLGAIRLFSLVVTTIVAIWLAYEGYGYYAIITKAILSSIITFFLALYFCKTRFGLAFDKATASSIFRFSGWLMASVLFRNIAHQVDKLLMPSLLSVDALGAYNRPKDFINQISSKLNGIFDSALFPVLSSLQDEKAKLARALKQSLSLLNIFAMLLTLTFAFNSELIIRVFFGEKWLDLSTVTIVLSFALVFNIDGRLSDCYLRSMGMTKVQFYFRIFESVLKIIGVVLGFRWGILGVAVSIVITNTISKLAKIIYIARQVGIMPHEVLWLIISSWRFVLLLIPVWVLASLLLPVGLMGNIIQALMFCGVIAAEFLFFPKLVGEEYTKYGYTKLVSFLSLKSTRKFI